MQINRLFEIVYILINKKTTTAKELADHFEVSQRTIYRDIEILCQSGIPIYTNKGKGGGICLLEHFVLNKSVLSEQEQNEILSALQGFKVTNYPDTEQVLSKLNSLFGSQNPDWIEVDFSNWSSNEEDKQKFVLLKEAILGQKVIQFDYYNSSGQETHRFVEPQKLLFKGQAWYLYGYCRDKEALRYYKITRMKNVRVEAETFSKYQEKQTNSITEDTFIEYGQKNATPLSPQHMIQLVLRVDSEMAYRVFDEFPKESITREENGQFLIRTKMQSGGWLLGYLLSYENHIEVVEPDDIRSEMVNKLKSALQKYSSN